MKKERLNVQAAKGHARKLSLLGLIGGKIEDGLRFSAPVQVFLRSHAFLGREFLKESNNSASG